MNTNYQIVVSDGYEQTTIVTETVHVEGYDGRWHQIAPYNHRMLKGATGYFKFAEKTPKGMPKSAFSVPVIEFYYYNEQPMMTLYIGKGLQANLVGHGLIHTNRFFVNDPNALIDLSFYSSPMVFQVFPIAPDLSQVWAGMAFKGGSQFTVNGREATVGFLVNVTTGSIRYFVVSSERWGREFGTTSGSVLVVATGFRDLAKLEGFEVGGPDASISLGEKWNSFLKFLKDCPKQTELLSNMPKLASGLKAIETFGDACSTQEDWTNWAKILMTASGCNPKEETFSFFDITGTSGGLEIAVCNVIGKVSKVGSKEDIARFMERNKTVTKQFSRLGNSFGVQRQMAY